ncbi:peptidase S1 and S6 chymotrypsin/Hap [Calothrix sp. NIES-4071]|nr:peptidase S1 and S6 chymotrypsin/Hap [Calothrix sp. NIES-4071]BAZ56551.1 peptidase S1 and S6 chymotrypsin/Hap [Calothrix sp. NIES-4105]
MNWRQNFIIITASFSGLSLLPALRVPHSMVAIQPSTKSQPQLQRIASSITVKILAGDFLGSGILIKKQGQVYTVVTNAHVLRAGKPPYQIQTHKGLLYSATPVEKLNVVSPHSTSLQKADLALLQFQSTDQNYPIASLGSTSKLNIGNEVYAAGFPGDTQANTDKGFVVKSGRVSFVLNKALEGGYQIAYTNDIQKGMSGGPVLNRAGEVIAINGMHAEPLWGNPYVYEDGTEPAVVVQKQMQQYSWGIPLENYLKSLLP